MKVRVYSNEDFNRVDEIYRKFHDSNFGIPNLYNTLRAVIVEENEEISGFGMLKLIPEAIMVLDLNRSPKIKTLTLSSLIQTALSTAKSNGYDGFHSFVKGDFSDKLEKHFSFRETEGKALYYDGSK
jgi:hypothetical protein